MIGILVAIAMGAAGATVLDFIGNTSVALVCGKEASVAEGATDAAQPVAETSTPDKPQGKDSEFQWM